MTVRLIERCERLKVRAEAASQEDRAATTAARYQHASEAFMSAVKQVEVADEIVAALRSAGISADGLAALAPLFGEARDQLKSGLRLKGHEFEAVATQSDISLQSAMSELAHAVSAALAGHQRAQPVPDSHLLDVLDPIAPKRTQRVRTAVASFSAASEDVDVFSSRSIERLASASKELRDAYSELTSELPPSVSDFLRRVPLGVGFDQVDADVLEWIRDQSAGGSFVIGLNR